MVCFMLFVTRQSGFEQAGLSIAEVKLFLGSDKFRLTIHFDISLREAA
jgi:uncharacterized protein YkuJ